jgi:hypothetical protein
MPRTHGCARKGCLVRSTACASRPAGRPAGRRRAVGLGWLINLEQRIHGHPGAGPGAAASLLIRGGTVTVVLTNRMVPVEPLNARLLG